MELSKSATRLLQQVNPISFHRLLQFITAIDIFPDREEVGFLLIFHRLLGGSVRCRFCFSFKKLLHNLFTLLTLSNLLRTNYKWKDFSSDVSLRCVSFPSAKKMPHVEMTTCRYLKNRSDYITAKDLKYDTAQVSETFGFRVR